MLREISQSMATSFQDLNHRTDALDEESAQLKGLVPLSFMLRSDSRTSSVDLIVDRDHQITELSGTHFL